MKHYVSLFSITLLLFPLWGLSLFLLQRKPELDFLNGQFSFISHSFLLAVGSSVPAVFVGLLASYTVSKSSSRFSRTTFLSAAITLLFIHPVVLLEVLRSLPFSHHLSSFAASALVYGIGNCAAAMLLSYPLFMDSSRHEAETLARRISQSRFSVLFHIKAPAIFEYFPILIFPLLLHSFFAHDVPSVLGYRTFGETIANLLSVSDNPDELAGVALFAACITLPSSIVLYILFRKLFSVSDTNGAGSFPTSYFSHSQNVFPAVWIVFMVILVLICFTTLTAKSFSSEEPFSELFHQNLSPIAYTAAMTLSASVTAMLLARILFASRHSCRCIPLLLLTLFIFPATILSFSLNIIFQTPPFHLLSAGNIPLFIGYTTILLPPAYFFRWLEERYGIKDYFLERVAIPYWKKTVHVVIPQKLPVWTGEFFLLLMWAQYQLDLPMFLLEPGREVLIVKMYNLLHYGDTASVAFLSLIQVAGATLFGLLGTASFRKVAE